MTPIDASLKVHRGAIPQLRDMPVTNDHSLEGSAVAGGVVPAGSQVCSPIRDCCLEAIALLTSLQSLAMAWYEASYQAIASDCRDVSSAMASKQQSRIGEHTCEPAGTTPPATADPSSE